MRGYRPEEIVGEVEGLEVLKDPESQNFAPRYVRGETDIRKIPESNLSEDIQFKEFDGDFNLIIYDRVNQNFTFDESNNDQEFFHRAVAFGRNYTLVQSISDTTVGPTEIDSNFENSRNLSVLYFLATDNGNYLYDNGYRDFPNNSSIKAHRKSQEILEEKPFDGRLLEPADD